MAVARPSRLGKPPALDQLQQHALAQPAAGDPQRQRRAGRRSPRAPGCRPAAAAPARGRARSARATSAIGVVTEHADAALERLVGELGAEQPAQRGGGAADRHGLGRRRRLEALERAGHVAAHLLELVHRGRVAAQVGVGQEARSRSGTTPTTPSARPARRPRSRSTRRRRRSPRSCPRRGWSSVRVAPTKDEARLLLARQHARAPCRRRLHRAHAARSRLGALRIAAVATATICSAPTSRATVAWVPPPRRSRRSSPAGSAPPSRGSCRSA